MDIQHRADPSPLPPFCGVKRPPPAAPDPDLYCVDLLPRFEVQGARGWGEMYPESSPFTLPLTAEGTLRWRLQVRVEDLPHPSVLDPKARAWVAWAVGATLDPELRLGVVIPGTPEAPGRPAEGSVPLDRFRVLVTAEADPETPVRSGPIGLRGDAPSLRVFPHDEPWLWGADPGPGDGHGGAGHGDPGAHGGHRGHGNPAAQAAPPGDAPHEHPSPETRPPRTWPMVPMHPEVPMPPGLHHLVPQVTPWLPEDALDPASGADALPLARPGAPHFLAPGDTLHLRAGPVRHRIRGEEHVVLAYNGQIPGPRLGARAGTRFQARVENALPFPTAVHWHGVRLGNRADGVPGVTQDPVDPGHTLTLEVDLPEAGRFWYHPHLREDVTQGLGLAGTLRVHPAGEGADRADPDAHRADPDAPRTDPDAPRAGPDAPWADPDAHRTVDWLLHDLLLADDGTLYPFGLEAPTHALMGRFGNLVLVNGEERPLLEVDRGEIVRITLTSAASARPFHLGFGETATGGAGGDPPPSPAPPRMKLVAGDLSPLAREAWVEGVVLAPAERWEILVRFDEPGEVPFLNRVQAVDHLGARFFPHVDTVAVVRVRETPAPSLPRGARPFETLHEDLRVRAEVEAARLPSPHNPPSGEVHTRELVLAMEVDRDALPFPLGPMLQMDSAWFAPVEWVSTMPEMNAPLTPREVRWILRDAETGAENGAIDWRFREGDRLRLRIRNEREVLHAMQHPVHLHGQRFLVEAVNGVPQEHPVWKDTVLVPTGWTVDLLVELDNPGDWMIHCHIAEHLEAGMHAIFRVDPREGRWEGWRGFEPGQGVPHHGHGPG